MVEEENPKMTQARVFNLWTPFIVWALVIFLFSSRPTTPVTQIHWEDFVVKKTAHVVEYFIFTTLLYRALKESGVEKKKAGIYAIIFGILYGATDEYHQSFTPGRLPKIRDILFDAIGSGLAIYTIWNLIPKAPEKLRNWAAKLQLT